MLLLVASVLALFVGPLLVRAVGPRPTLLAAIDGFVLVALGGLVLLHLLPEAIASGGRGAVAAGGLGLLVTPVVQRATGARDRVRTALLLVALAGLGLHALIDGAGLALEGTQHGQSPGLLAAAILLHRVPVGLAIWWLAARDGQARRALVLILVITAATAVGYYGSRPLLARLSGQGLAIAQAGLAGVLLHAVFSHRPDAGGEDSPLSRRWAAAGALLAAGVLVVLAMFEAGPPRSRGLSPLTTFAAMAHHTAPVLLGALLAAGLLRALAWHRAQADGLVPAIVAAFWGQHPSTPSQVSPRAGSALSVMAPHLDLVSLLLAVPLLGAELALVRVSGVTLLALGAALAIGHGRRDEALAPGRLDVEHGALRAGLAHAFGTLLDRLAPQVVAALVLASLAEPLLDGAWLARVPPWLQVPLIALCAVPFHFGAAGSVVLAWLLLHKGLSAGAAVAFLLAAPSVNLVALQAWSRSSGRRAAVGVAATVALSAAALGYAVNAFVPRTAIFTLRQLEQPSPVRTACLAILAVAVLVSLTRQGPRAFIEQLAPSRR